MIQCVLESVFTGDLGRTTLFINYHITVFITLVQVFGINLETLLNKASAITASDEVTEYDDLADFGLDDPANTVTLKTDSGLTTIYIGSQNEITNEYYLKTGDSDTIYVVDSAPATGFDKSVEDLTAKADDTETEAEEPSEAVDETETATVVPNETEAVVTEETK